MIQGQTKQQCNGKAKILQYSNVQKTNKRQAFTSSKCKGCVYCETRHGTSKQEEKGD
jgi:hypothetical protein